MTLPERNVSWDQCDYFGWFGWFNPLDFLANPLDFSNFGWIGWILAVLAGFVQWISFPIHRNLLKIITLTLTLNPNPGIRHVGGTLAAMTAGGNVELWRSSILLLYYMGYLCMVVFFGANSDS